MRPARLFGATLPYSSTKTKHIFVLHQQRGRQAADPVAGVQPAGLMRSKRERLGVEKKGRHKVGCQRCDGVKGALKPKKCTGEMVDSPTTVQVTARTHSAPKHNEQGSLAGSLAQDCMHGLL